MPGWFPEAVAGAGQIVLLVIDGLGEEQLRERASLAPLLAGVGGPITSVAPSTTACALTTLVTGKVPAEHGVVGYRVALDGDVMNVLQWSLDGVDARMRVPAATFQPCPSFPGAAGPVPVVTRQDFGPTGFTAAHLGDVDLHRWHTPAGLVTAVRELTSGGAPFVYAYYEGIDKVAHAGAWAPTTTTSSVPSTGSWATSSRRMPSGSALVVTADHGQVEVGGSVEVIGPEIMEAVTLLSGEGRFRWLHVRPGAADDVAAAATELHGDVAWVRTREQLVDEDWLGRRALGGGGGTPGRRGPGAVRAHGLPRSGRHRGAAPQGPPRVAHRRRDVHPPAGLAGIREPAASVATWRAAPVARAAPVRGRRGRSDGRRREARWLTRRATTGPRSRRPTATATDGVISPDEVLAAAAADEAEEESTESVNEPAKVLRIGSMVKTLLDEVRSAPLDEKSRVRLREIYEQSIRDLSEVLSPDLVAELERMAPPFGNDAPSDAELRIAQAQLVGWLEGLFHGIQATLMSQQMAARAQLEEMRQRGLPSAGESGRPGTYL